MDLHKMNVGIKEILQLESLRYFYFRNLLIWKFMYIKIHLELLYYYS